MDKQRKSSWRRGCLIGLAGLVCVVARPTGGQQPPQKQVYVALYERGPAWVEGRSVKELPKFAEHLAHIRAIESQLLGVGPFAGNPGDSFVGMMVLVASSEDDARKLAESDPFVVAKYTRVTKVLRWQVSDLKGCS